MKPRTLLSLLCLTSACSAPTPGPIPTPAIDVAARVEAPRSGEATLLLMADLRGVLRPCGCTVELQKGGFDRLIPYLAEEKKHHPGAELLHAGPMFYEDAAIDAKKKAQRERQAEVLADPPSLGVAGHEGQRARLRRPEREHQPGGVRGLARGELEHAVASLLVATPQEPALVRGLLREERDHVLRHVEGQRARLARRHDGRGAAR